MFSKKPSTEAGLKKEHILSKGFFARFFHSLLNNIFGLHPEKIKKRAQNVVLLFLVSWLLLILLHHPLNLWIQNLGDIYLFLFDPAYDMNYVDANPFTKFFTLIFDAATDARTVQYLLLFLVSFFIAIRLAATYQADIFELDDVDVAQRFLFQVALVGSEETILIEHGEIAEQHRYTTTYLLGGPGKVIVDNDSVAVFERADGTPHLIGPTGKEPDGKAMIEGFERFRQAINIRDQWGEFYDQSDRSPSVMARSRDGIPFVATNVDFVYSIYRGENPKPSPDVPFPFSKDAVENLMYKSRSRVVLDLPYTSIYEFSWINNLLGQVRGKLSDFMSSQNLTEHFPHIMSTFKPPHSNGEVAQKVVCQELCKS